MKKNAGFTLIELLTSIVILGLLALIAVPKILKTIDEAKLELFRTNVTKVSEAAKQGYYLNEMSNKTNELTEYKYDDYEQSLVQGNVEISYDGTMPKKGSLVVSKEGEIAFYFYQDGLCATKQYYNKDIVVEKLKEEDCVLPVSIVSEYNYNKAVNKPVLTTGMTPIKWNGTEWVNTNSDDEEWYDYSNKKWANVKTDDGSYFVWIPRYAYRIKSGFHTNVAGEIGIKFLIGTSNETADGTSIMSSGYAIGTNDTSQYYFTHPSFSQGGEEITGFWVAKFEPSGTSTDIAVVPDAISLRSMTLKEQYTSAYNMRSNSRYGWNSTEADTHMATNLEWGAIAYLSQSEYGKAEEVWINPANNYMTGCAGTSVSSTATNGCLYHYYTINGMETSTTGNVYGVYDMSGGAWERVMANYNNLVGNSGFTTNELNQISSKYITRYTTATENLLNGVGMDYDNSIYGDAVYETSGAIYRYNGSTWVGSPSASWNGDYSYIPHSFSPFFVRNGVISDRSYAGLYGYSKYNGESSTSVSFRPTLFVK